MVSRDLTWKEKKKQLLSEIHIVYLSVHQVGPPGIGNKQKEIMVPKDELLRPLDVLDRPHLF